MTQKFNGTATIPAVTRYNYVTKKTDTIVPSYEAKIEIELDVEKVAQVFGVKAARNASRKALDAGRALIIRVKSPAPAAVAKITDEHKYVERRGTTDVDFAAAA